MSEVAYCQNCGWSGIPQSDRCPNCQRMGHFMNKPQKQSIIEKTASVPKSATPATA